MKEEPIKTQKEYNRVFTSLVNETMKVTGCDKPQAEKRIYALLKSGILEGGNPESTFTQRKIDEFMFTPIK